MNTHNPMHDIIIMVSCVLVYMNTKVYPASVIPHRHILEPLYCKVETDNVVLVKIIQYRTTQIHTHMQTQSHSLLSRSYTIPYT